jgi:hypothetical protein
VVESIAAKSREYRCALSNRLMVIPVTHDGNLYEQSIHESHSPLITAQMMPQLKDKIADFSKESLKMLETCLKQRAPQDSILELTAECLSVLSLETETDTFLRVLGTVNGEAMKKLTRKLRDLVQEEMLITLINQIARELPSHALTLTRLVLLDSQNKRAFEEAFRYLNEVLSQAELTAGALDLAEESRRS